MLLSDGSLYAWGDNTYGQLGDGTTENRNTPTLIGTGYTAIAAGSMHTLALKGSDLYAWGWNNLGQLGDGTSINRNTPTLIGSGYTAIAAGGVHSLALKGSALYAWGRNDSGELGDGTYINRNTPTLIGSGYTAIVAGNHSLALKGSALYAWGRNESGQLGDSTNTHRNVPTLIGTGYTAITAGDLHSLALRGSVLYAWGDNTYGQLGDGTKENRNTPTLIGTGYTSITACSMHTLALKGSALYAWGWNNFGQLGDGTLVDKVAPIMIGTGFISIEAGGGHSLALKASKLYAWGANMSGQLGDGTTTQCNTPIRVELPALAAPLYIARFSVRNAILSIGDKATFTVVTDKNVTKVHLYKEGGLIASTKSYKSQDGKRIWTFSPIMTTSGDFQYWAVASNRSDNSADSAKVEVSVSTSSLEIKGFTANSPALDVGETVTFMVKTGSRANKVSILDASDAIFASSSKPTKTTSNQKIWILSYKLTEGDMGSLVLHAQVDSAYGTGPSSETLEIKVTDNLPRIISVIAENPGVKRGLELRFQVETNAASTSVWISNDRNEKWQQTEVASSTANRRSWQVITLPMQLGSRKFYAQAYRGALPSSKVVVRKILVIK